MDSPAEQGGPRNSQPEEDDTDALLASLEDEDDSSYRTQRLNELKSASAATQTTTTFNTSKNHYITLTSDDQALSFTTEHERAVVHFLHPDFARCNTMDTHCQIIAEKHAEYGNADVAFARVDVKNCPFVVEKLGVRVLPCVIGFVKGVVKGRITGFEGLCWDGKEGSMNVTRAVEEALMSWSILRKRLLFAHDDEASDDDDDDANNGSDRRRAGRRGIQGRKQQIEDADDDWD
ncbi:hypothetical protein PV08_03820 [Exophiala spinifera]|uniref:Thioredoxin domain-containing protein n=1 Tax=Exophiala spinifera TaxID=91928 RepID=A0A0D1ZV80_9EURO|nr:uncharacterized protein PV08_03820 [Exophiala spinifera]KIW16632.1 hypothetical protein PV08_03820 [Exophiala spinifera]